MNCDYLVKKTAEEYISKNIQYLQNLKSQAGTIVNIAEIFIEAIRRGNKILFFGNGGSAADAQHLGAEFVGRFKLERKGLPAMALTTNTSSLTSIGNDYGFEQVFSRQVEALGEKGDVAVGISTSGNAKNVVAGIEMAKKMELRTVAFSGGDGGDLSKLADIALIVPANDTANVQELHITAGHIICELAEKALVLCNISS